MLFFGTVRLVRRTEKGKYGTVRTFEQYCYSLVTTCFEIEVLDRVGGENVSNVLGGSGVSSDSDESVHVECACVRRLVVRKILKTSPFSARKIQSLKTASLVVLIKRNFGFQLKQKRHVINQLL